MGFRLIFESFYKNNNVRVIHTLPRDKYLKYLSQSLVYIDLYSEGYPNCSKSAMESISIGVPTVCRNHIWTSKTSLMTDEISDSDYYSVNENRCFDKISEIVDGFDSGIDITDKYTPNINECFKKKNILDSLSDFLLLK